MDKRFRSSFEKWRPLTARRDSQVAGFLTGLLLMAFLLFLLIRWLNRLREQEQLQFSQGRDTNVESLELERFDPRAAERASRVEKSSFESAISPDEQGDSSDDLERIEGIGPKIAGLLREAGIRSFRQLAKSKPEDLEQILRDSNFRGWALANPASWPEQAALAANGDVEKLQALQERLKAGRRQN